MRPSSDLEGALSGTGQNALLLQAIVFAKNATGTGDPRGILNVTGDGISGNIGLPYFDDNGTQVMLGDPGLGYPPNLYPNLTFTSSVVNSTYNASNAFYNGLPLFSDSTLVIGPWSLNQSFSLLSITVAINNNTSRTDILGWLTVLVDCRMLYNIVNSPEGLDTTGQVLIVAPNQPNNLYRVNPKTAPASALGDQEVKFVLPPQNNATLGNRHLDRAYNSTGGPELPFQMKSFPAVLNAYTKDSHAVNNAAAMINSHNEEGKEVSVGYAVPNSAMVDWILVFEQSHHEVTAPITHLRNVLLACESSRIANGPRFMLISYHYRRLWDRWRPSPRDASNCTLFGPSHPSSTRCDSKNGRAIHTTIHTRKSPFTWLSPGIYGSRILRGRCWYR